VFVVTVFSLVLKERLTKSALTFWILFRIVLLLSAMDAIIEQKISSRLQALDIAEDVIKESQKKMHRFDHEIKTMKELQNALEPKNTVNMSTSMDSCKTQHIPWKPVFEFLDGKDAARASMACSEWSEDIAHDMTQRLRSAALGRTLLQRYGTDISLPKLVFLLDSGCYCRTDGVYCNPELPVNYYVRFYPDGFVMTVCSTGTPQQIMRWFRREQAGASFSTGSYLNNYKRNNLKMISFSSTCGVGTVDYAGEVSLIGESVLRLDSYSRINGHKATREYQFIQIEDQE